MKSEKAEFRRVGPPKVTEKIADNFFTVEVKLDGTPDCDWIDCFNHPTNYKPNEAHPTRAFVVSDKITFSSSESNIKTNIEWMDNYIQQANDCYSKKRLEQTAFQNKALEQARKHQEELDRLNESLKGL
jgi:hypothetical protein